MTSQAEAEAGLHSRLFELAKLWGIEVTYHDVTGQQRTAPADSLLAILPILGATVATESEVKEAVHQRQLALWQRVLEPVIVAWDGGLVQIPVRVPQGCADDRIAWRVQLEDGAQLTGEVELARLGDEGVKQIERAHYVEKRLLVPHSVPMGYHSLQVEIRGRAFPATIIAAPRKAYVPQQCGWHRSWGVFMPLYALHSRQSWGSGDFHDLRQLHSWARSQGATFVGTLPLLAAFLDEPFEISPYSPVSRLFWNEFYLNIEQISEVSQSAAARKLLESTELIRTREHLQSMPLVDYRSEMHLKRQVLEAAADEFFAGQSARRADFDNYVRQHPRLDDYAAFRAVGERLRIAWTQWPSELRQGTVSADSFDQNAKRYHTFVQWLADEQLQKVAGRDQGGLYLDLPLGVNADGYDVWRERSVFAVGAAGGCPPDLMFPKGQNWGFVPLHPEGIRENGYRYVRDYLQHQLRFADVLRIDHMPSFHRVFWIAPGQDASQGVYVRYRADEMYAVFCLESHRHKTMLVGEDLGTVPPEVPAAMAKHRLHRMFIVQYELKPDDEVPLPALPAYAIASINTHDMPPFAGFWQGTDIAEKSDVGLLTENDQAEQQLTRELMKRALRNALGSASQTDEIQDDTLEILRRCIELLRDSPARMVLINLEDLWLETHSQNIPSTATQNPNWRRKARYSLDDIVHNQQVLELLHQLNQGFSRGATD